MDNPNPLSDLSSSVSPLTSASPAHDPDAASGELLPVNIPFAPVSEAESSALPLSPAQRTALQLLTAGHTVASAALAAGVHRATLHRWLRVDDEFAAAYNAWQLDILATARGRLLALTDSAVTALQRALTNGNGRLALELLRDMGLTTSPQPGPTDATEIQQNKELAANQAKLDRKRRANELFMETITSPNFQA